MESVNEMFDEIRGSTNTEEKRKQEAEDAAVTIQRAWRKKVAASSRSKLIDPDARWKDAAIHAQMQVDRQGADRGRNDPKTRWKRAAFLAARLQDTNSMYEKDTPVHDIPSVEKILETQHWLELVDAKHRYGSNLKWYHRRWQQEDTTDNFFKWLDRGAGKDLTLNECPRERLEKERIVYLAPEERLNYLVNFDNEGKLRWARNGVLVDTTPNRWKDQGQGRGVIEVNKAEDLPRRSSFTSSVSSLSVSSGSIQENEASHYVGRANGQSHCMHLLRSRMTPKGMMDRLLRKTVRKNTWIYVADKSFNVFIGIKETGTFQHSSFVGGGVVVSAGLISVKDGLISKLSPLSGHYRTSINHFRGFVDGLSAHGVDMSHAKISSAEAALWGIEHLTKVKKIQGKITKKSKDEVKRVAASIAVSGHPNQHWKRDILEGRRKQQQSGMNNSAKENSRQENVGHQGPKSTG